MAFFFLQVFVLPFAVLFAQMIVSLCAQCATTQNMNATNHIYLALLKASISGIAPCLPHRGSLSDEEWRGVIDVSRKQKNFALVADAILSLPPQSLPSEELVGWLLSLLQKHQMHKAQYMTCLSHLLGIYANAGVACVLLKGKTLEPYYTKPALRGVGDIDVWFPDSQHLLRANALLQSQGGVIERHSFHETVYRYRGYEVEHHRAIHNFGRRKYDKLFALLLRSEITEHGLQQCQTDGISYHQLPTDIYAFYLFYHLFYHYLYLGIGIRQLYDWSLFLIHHHHAIDKEKLQLWAKQFDMTEAMQVFSAVAYRYLGVSADVFPCGVSAPNHHIQMVIDDIMRGGDFGKDNYAKSGYKTELHRRWAMWQIMTRRAMRNYPISPSIIMRMPLVAIKVRLQSLFSRKPDERG